MIGLTVALLLFFYRLFLFLIVHFYLKANVKAENSPILERDPVIRLDTIESIPYYS